MKQNLDLLITGGNVFLHNELIEEIDIGVLNGKIVELGDLSQRDSKKNFSKKPSCATWSNRFASAFQRTRFNS